MRINIRLMDFSFQSKLNLWDKFSRKSLSVSSKFKTFFPFCFCFVQHRVFFLYFIISLVRICHHTKTTPMCSLYISYLRLIYFVTQSLYLLISLTYFFPCLHPSSSLTTTSLFWAKSLNRHFPGKTYRWPTGRKDSQYHLSLLLLLSHFSRVRLCVTPQMAAHQAPVPGILQARTLEWVAISFSNV